MAQQKHLADHHPFAHHPPEALIASANEWQQGIEPSLCWNLVCSHLQHAISIDSDATPTGIQQEFQPVAEDPGRPSPAGSRYRHLCITCPAGRTVLSDLRRPESHLSVCGSAGKPEAAVLLTGKTNCFATQTIRSLNVSINRRCAAALPAKKPSASKSCCSYSREDYVTHIDHGVGVYAGLEKLDVGGKIQEAVRLKYKDGDLLYVNINSLHKINKFSGKDGTPPKLNKLGK